MKVVGRLLSLAAQQRMFAQGITADIAPEEAGKLFRLTPQGGLPHLEIYRNAYRARLTEALRENYPVLHRVLGDEAFDALAESFIAAHPSRQYSIRWFGSSLADFLAAQPEALPHAALPDLARMEWALGTAFDAADDVPLSVDSLLSLTPESWATLQLASHASVCLIALDWAVEPLWRAVSEDAEAETTPPERHPHHLLVWRQDQHTQWRSVESDEADLLRVALDGTSFAELCEHAALTHGEQAAATVAGYLRVWVAARLLAA